MRSHRRTLAIDWLEQREMLSTTQNFDTPGTGYSLSQIAGPPAAAITTGGPTGSYLLLATKTTNLNGNNNSISFVTSDPGTFNETVADWDFRINKTGGTGLGMSFGLLNTAPPPLFGTSGPAATSSSPASALYDGSLGIGIDPQSDLVNLSYNSAIVTTKDLTGLLDLASGQFIHARADINFVTSTVTLVLTPTGGGAPVTVFNSELVNGLVPYQARVSYQAQNTFTNFADYGLDNVNVVWIGPRLPGTISFGSTTFTVLENQPVANINIVRTGGTAGSVSIGFVSADGTARHGQNYVSLAGNIVFGEGETLKTVQLPIIDDGIVNGNKTVLLYLSNPTLAATLSPPITSTLTIIETDPVPPTVSTKVTPVYLNNTRRISGFRLTFSEPMDKASAENLANYQVTLPPDRKNGPVRVIVLTSAVLDPDGRSVTLYRSNLRQHLSRPIRFVVRGTPPTGLRNTGGTFLAGSPSGQAGTDASFIARI